MTLPGIPSKQAVVRWRQGKSYGITFQRLLALAELVEWLRDQRELLRATN